MSEFDVFDEIYHEYLEQLAQVDLNHVKDRLGLTVDGSEAILSFFGIPHRISRAGITDGAEGSVTPWLPGRCLRILSRSTAP